MSSAEVTVAGNLTADPELRYTQDGTPVAGFTVAHTPRRLNRQTNEWEDAGDAVFLRVSVWREQGQNVAHSLRKGDPVIVIGRLVSRSWEKDGETRHTMECQADIVSVDLRRARAERVARVRNGQAEQVTDEPWSTSGDNVTPLNAPAAKSA